jgi:hypothetical protein
VATGEPASRLRQEFGQQSAAAALRGIRGSAVGFGIAAAVRAESASLTGVHGSQKGTLLRVAKAEAPGGDRQPRVALRLPWAPIRFLMSAEPGACAPEAACPLSAKTETRHCCTRVSDSQTTGGQTRAAPAASLASVWPDILAHVPAEDRQLAERILMMPLIAARDEDLADVIVTQVPGAFGFAIVEGVVLKETILAGRSSLELWGQVTFSRRR